MVKMLNPGLLCDLFQLEPWYPMGHFLLCQEKVDLGLHALPAFPHPHRGLRLYRSCRKWCLPVLGRHGGGSSVAIVPQPSRDLRGKVVLGPYIGYTDPALAALIFPPPLPFNFMLSTVHFLSEPVRALPRFSALSSVSVPPDFTSGFKGPFASTDCLGAMVGLMLTSSS